MYTILVGIIIFIAVLLVLIILAQNPKGGGLSSTFGGSSTNQIMGVQKTNDLLEKTTWALAISIVVLTLVSNLFITKIENNIDGMSPNIDRANEQNVIQSSPNPNDIGELPQELDSSL